MRLEVVLVPGEVAALLFRVPRSGFHTLIISSLLSQPKNPPDMRLALRETFRLHEAFNRPYSPVS